MRFNGKMIFTMMMFMVFCQYAFAGTLSGRIIKEDGKSLAKTRIVIEGKETSTNDFGGFQVELPDGERELPVSIESVNYTSERVRQRAERLLMVHPLRAAGAFQLGAALLWTEEAALGSELVCLDQNLREAALKEGFSLFP